MARIGLVGPSYRSQAVNAACQLTMNWYPEIIEPGNDKVPLALYPTPGTRSFAVLNGSSTRGLCYVNGRLFAVSGTELVELDAVGAVTVRGTVADDGQPARFAYTDIHLTVVAGNKLYVLELMTNTLTEIADPPYVRDVVNIDGFFIVLCDKRNLRVSQVYNALSWPGAQIIAVSVFYEDVVGIIAAQRELGVLGSKRSVIYQDTGSAQIFDVVPGSLIEQGLGAPLSGAVLDNTAFWLGQDAQGAMVAYRLQGYTPARISTHAIELAWQGYSVMAREGAVTYSYQDRGHLFWVVYFPGASTTWVYDVSTQLWHERAYLRADGQYEAHHSWCHAYAFGKHLVGDWSSGRVYEMSIDILEDVDSRPIRRARRATHLSDEEAWSFHHRIQVDLETGLGPQPPFTKLGTVIAAQDNFDRANGSLGSAWTAYVDLVIGIVGAPSIFGQQVVDPGPNPSDYHAAVYTAGAAPANDQRVSVILSKVVPPSPDWEVALLLRADVSSKTGYIFGFQHTVAAGRTVVIGRLTSGAIILLTSNLPVARPWAAGDVLVAEAVGSSLRLYCNDVLLASATDAAVPSGRAGLTIFSPNNFNKLSLDNFLVESYQQVARAPELNLRWSDDGGHSWTQDRPVGCGLAAEFRTRALWNRLGRTRNRVYEINASDPVPWRILDAYLKASAGNGA